MRYYYKRKDNTHYCVSDYLLKNKNYIQITEAEYNEYMGIVS